MIDLKEILKKIKEIYKMAKSIILKTIQSLKTKFVTVPDNILESTTEETEPTGQYYEESVRNGDFEDGTDFWSGRNDGTISVVQQNTHSGINALKVVNGGSDEDNYVEQDITDRLTAIFAIHQQSMNFDVDFWFKVDALSDKIETRLKYNDDEGDHDILLDSTASPAVGKWIHVDVDKSLSYLENLNNAFLYFKVWDNAGNSIYPTLYLDDVSFDISDVQA